MMKYDEKVDIFSFGIVLCEVSVVSANANIDEGNEIKLEHFTDNWTSSSRSRFSATHIGLWAESKSFSREILPSMSRHIL